jgi:hypothetical protein
MKYGIGLGFFSLFAALIILKGVFAQGEWDVELLELEADQKVEVHIGGKPFTSYQFGKKFSMKPVFYPVFSPSGIKVNREIPFEDEELRKQQDHPHHQSLFLGYGDVEGLDFWSHRDNAVIVHRSLLEVRSGANNSLDYLADWINGEGEAVVREIRSVKFGGSRDCFWMDHKINLTALGKDRPFTDTKEGMFAMRVAESLREDKGTGRYLNAFGWETEKEIWGQRAPWVALRGEIEGQPVAVVIFDHPSTENYPSYWHARAYGLFSVNPFGRKDFVKDSTPINKVLPAGESYNFRYRLLVYQGRIGKLRLDRDYSAYIN